MLYGVLNLGVCNFEVRSLFAARKLHTDREREGGGGRARAEEREAKGWIEE